MMLKRNHSHRAIWLPVSLQSLEYVESSDQRFTGDVDDRLTPWANMSPTVRQPWRLQRSHQSILSLRSLELPKVPVAPQLSSP